jgi:hypothetical protein
MHRVKTSQKIVAKIILQYIFLILCVSALVIFLKSVSYEDNTLVFENEAQYYILHIISWLIVVYTLYATSLYYTDKDTKYTVAYFQPTSRYFLIIRTLVVLNLILSVVFLQMGEKQGLVVYLPNTYCIFGLIISLGLYLLGYALYLLQATFNSLIPELKNIISPNQRHSPYMNKSV